jgi:hypothetical protein
VCKGLLFDNSCDLLPAAGTKQPQFTITELINLHHTRYGSCLLDVDAVAYNYKTISTLRIITSILSATRIESLVKSIIKRTLLRALRKRKLLISFVF